MNETLGKIILHVCMNAPDANFFKMGPSNIILSGLKYFSFWVKNTLFILV